MLSLRTSAPAYCAADVERLLLVCRKDLGAADAPDSITIAESGWHGLIAAAVDHGLIGPLYSSVSQIGPIPGEIVSVIRAHYLAQVAQNFHLTTALGEIVRNFRAAGIEVAVLKGPAVALLVYAGIAQREFTDLDLLVHPEDFTRAQSVLEGLDYHPSRTIDNLHSEKDIQLFRELDDTLVELHWALNPPDSRFPLETTGIWERLETVRVFDELVRTLNLEDTLIALCIHAAKHRWTSLKWTFDIAQIVTRKTDALDWDALLGRCAAVGCTRTLLFSMQLASRLFATPIHGKLTKPLRSATSLVRLVEVVTDSLIHSTRPGTTDLMACQIEIHDRLWDRLFVAVTQPAPELPRLLPESAGPITSGPLRFITRPVRLLHRYGVNWLRTAIVGR